ncbi:unnamed protein product [Somion occarium]|uniref:Heterokaryon incompatibility domain-containing protein n=1 Tax=Somion occarium TaxID=3059160 RepID=A0ABP1CR29_9APHY
MELRLLVPASPELQSPGPSIDLDGQRWILTEPLDVNGGDIPPYVCVSYVWGKDTMPNLNPFHPDIPMSSRTHSVVCATVRSIRPSAIWVDAFCIPPSPVVTRRATLESMGYIYGHAKCVVAVLSPHSFSAVLEMSRVRNPDETKFYLLDILEKDSWVESIWTYQEIVNNTEIFFIGEDSGGAVLEGPLAARRRYPKLDAFEDLVADWRCDLPCSRCAAGIISNLDRRVYDDKKNYFYSMIGAVADTPSGRSTASTVDSLAEKFMSICERKGDYSFIFTSTPRDERPGYRWRPRPGMVRALITYRCEGERLEGVREGDNIMLKDIIIARRAPSVNSNGISYIREWLKLGKNAEYETDEILALFLQALRTLDFTGSQHYITTDDGAFFPQNEISQDTPVLIYISRSLRYANFGAPGLAVIGEGQHKVYIPGVFAGFRDVESQSEILL